MTKIAILSDVHANDFALKAVLDDIAQMGCDEIIHLGDAIAIGPQPVEVLHRLETENVLSIKGNHELYAFVGIPKTQDMDFAEHLHHEWVRAQLTKTHMQMIKDFPYQVITAVEGQTVRYVHFPFTVDAEGVCEFMHSNKAQTPEALFELFSDHPVDLVFFGHTHKPVDLTDPKTGRRYINPGALGCSTDDHAQYVIATFDDGQCHVTFKKVPYDKKALLQAMTTTKAPDYYNLMRWFHGTDIYSHCPPLENETLILRKTQMDDANALLKCYSDVEAAKLFNGDNCNGDDFYYTSIDRMEKALDFWKFSYDSRYFVRFSIIDKKTQKIIGTTEMFRREADDAYHHYGVLRIDLQSAFENENTIYALLGIVNSYFFSAFDVTKIVTKAVPAASTRIKCLKSYAYLPMENGFNGYSDYFITCL